MLRIERVQANGTEVLRLEGKILGSWVAELRRSCEQSLERAAQVTLDLADVTYIDLDGVALLKELAARHVDVTNCSPFAAEQLGLNDCKPV